MPRELLPRLTRASEYTPSKFPYATQHTLNDVRAIRYARSKANAGKKRARHWSTLQVRLREYAATGRGTFAEAIVYNDCYWLGQELMRSLLAAKLKQHRTESARYKKRR
jgi:hypothetical protein